MAVAIESRKGPAIAQCTIRSDRANRRILTGLCGFAGKGLRGFGGAGGAARVRASTGGAADGGDPASGAGLPGSSAAAGRSASLVSMVFGSSMVFNDTGHTPWGFLGRYGPAFHSPRSVACDSARRRPRDGPG